MRVVIISAICGALATCAYPPDLLDQVLLSGELRVATRNGPGTFYHGPTEPRGLEYDLAKGYAERLGVRLNVYEVESFPQILADVQQGRAHLGAAGLSATEARRRIVDFGPAYLQVQPLVIYRRGARGPKALSDLLNGRLEVLAGSSDVTALEAARAEQPGLKWVEIPGVGVVELARRVAEGESDFTIVDSNLFELLRHTIPGVEAAFGLGGETPVAWAFRRSPDSSFGDSVADYFAELEASDQLAGIIERYYFHVEDEFDYVGSQAFIRHFGSRLPSYRDFFLRAATETGLDWRLLAAMAYQESHWDPEAVSPTGVRGMMMLTQGTARMMGVDDRTDAFESITGGAAYFIRVIDKIPPRIAEPDRTWLALAAYNVGFGHLEDARIITEIQSGDPDSWEQVRERLPLLADPDWYQRVSRGFARGWEPVRYVDNIRRYYEILQWMTAGDSTGAPVYAAGD
ncbi:MAG: membrane-bound lytic murein transglycosylase MltF [Rhodospirillaceae bacterium]|nr:membrane-bound lytic murein transglycosylase MltF [Rhodospirillaceae bacterium]